MADSSCAQVNKIYDDSRNVSRYQVTLVWTPPGGTSDRLLLAQRFNGRDMFESDTKGNWFRYPRPLMIAHSDPPTFSNCVRQPDTIVDGKMVVSFNGQWQRNRSSAVFGVRIWAETGRAIDFTRKMTVVDKGEPFDVVGAIVVDKFTYDRSVPNPTSYR